MGSLGRERDRRAALPRSGPRHGSRSRRPATIGRKRRVGLARRFRRAAGVTAPADFSAAGWRECLAAFGARTISPPRCCGVWERGRLFRRAGEPSLFARPEAYDEGRHGVSFLLRVGVARQVRPTQRPRRSAGPLTGPLSGRTEDRPGPPSSPLPWEGACWAQAKPGGSRSGRSDSSRRGGGRSSGEQPPERGGRRGSGVDRACSAICCAVDPSLSGPNVALCGQVFHVKHPRA